MAECMDLVHRVEMDLVDLVDDLAEKIAAFHPVAYATEDSCNNVPPVTSIHSLQRAHVGKQSGRFFLVGTLDLIVIDELLQLIAGYTRLVCSPITPSVRFLNCRTESLASHLCFFLAHLFEVVEELEEHDPRQHRQAVKVAIETLVLPHNIPRRFNDAGELLGGGEGLLCFLV